MEDEAGNNPLFRKNYSGRMTDLEGKDTFRRVSVASRAYCLLFRGVLNPLDYNGSFMREMEETYKTNELGFFIGLCFFGALMW